MATTPTRRITDIERTMFEKGYASSGCVSAKIGRDRTTVGRLFRTGVLTGKTVAGQGFISLESVTEYMGEDAIDLFGLDDWSDVMPAEEGEVEEPAPKKRGRKKA